MYIELSPEVKKELQVVKRKDHRLFHQINKQLNLFSQNPRHKSLRLHKLKGNQKNIWSLSVTGNFRMLYVILDDVYYFVDIGTHDQVYKK